MKRAITFSFFMFAMFAFSFGTFAQDISVSTKQVTETTGQIDPIERGSVTITHSATQTIVSGNSVSCNSGGLHTDNSYWRSFVLADFGITDDFNVTTVEIGVETATGAGGTQPITINLYTTDAAFPTGTLTLIGTASVDVTDQTLSILPVAVTGLAPAGSELVVEVFTPDGQTAGNSFFIGSNPDGQTAPSYLSAADCGITDPTDVAAIGFPDMMIVMNVTGDVGGGGGGTLAFMDDFEAGAGNWDITNDGGTCVWEVFGLDTMGYTMPPEAMLNVLAADADVCGSGSTTLTTATMLTGVDATDWEFVWIEFDNDWRTIDADDAAYVEMSIDGGTTWTEVVSWVGVDNRDTHEIWDVSPTAGFQSDVRFRFRSVQPGWDWWWAIDNFAIYFDGFVPVELTSFAASVNDGEVTLNWSTSTETNNQGFEVERNSGNGFQKIGFVAGFGTTTETHSYSYVDGSLKEGSYTYRLKQIDYDGTFEYSDVVEVDVTVPKVFSLEQNYPNPFNPSTQINFSLAVDSKVSLTVFDILGQEVANLISGNLAAGAHEFNFNASNINSGVYFYRLNATGVDGTNFTSVKKMILTK